jgi:hypothetical protein
MAVILKRTSFGLIRTNPKLTTNIKIVADSKNQVFLESIDADPLLTKSIYKGFEVTGGSYQNDLRRFYSQGTLPLPKSIAYKVYEKDKSLEVKNRYKDQYDFTYAMGMQPKNSRIYSEEFSLFSPLWVEKDSIPDYFVIFKLDGPVTLDYNSYPSSFNLDSSKELNNLIVNPTYFFNNFLKDSKIIKTFSLKDDSFIGKYIRDYVNDELFPEASLYASLDKQNLSYWNGISYDQGGFCKKGENIYKEYTIVDKTITESDDFITMGFYRNSVVHPNILNIEFLFDDEDQEKYKFSRYFGLYVSEAELGKFEIDGNRLFLDKDNEESQLPKPIKNNVGYLDETRNQLQANKRGIKVYPKLSIGGTSIYQGRLIEWSEVQSPRFPYIKDVNGNFYSINQTNDWNSYTSLTGGTGIIDNRYLRIKNQKINWKNFSGMTQPIGYVDYLKTDKRGRPSFSFKVESKITDGDQIRIQLTDWTDPNQIDEINYHTIVADSSLSAGTSNGLVFSTKGTLQQVAFSISKCINNIQEITRENKIFSSISIGNRVIVFCRVDSENWNKIKYSLFSTSFTFPWSLPNKNISIEQKTYLPSPIETSVLISGKYYESNFTGGNDKPNTRFVINSEDLDDFYDFIDPIYVKTNLGFDTIGDYSMYLDEPIYNERGIIIGFNNLEKYLVLETKNKEDIVFYSSKKISLFQSLKNSLGFLTIFPIRDFDFDFRDTTYVKDSDSSLTDFNNWYKGSTSYGPTATFSYATIGVTAQRFIKQISADDSDFVVSGKFSSIKGIQATEVSDKKITLVNEYDRLKENDISEIALSSRVVPFINKWVYDNESVDIRENPYRLNVDQAFGYSNFSPSFEEVKRNPKFFTHEWYYLQKYPPYMSFEQKLNSYSYFDEDLNFPNIPFPGTLGSTSTYNTLTGSTGNLLSIKEDYFLSYFTRETIGGSAIPRDFKYSIFEYGDDINFSETLFRGVKVILKDRTEFSDINFNIPSLNFVSNPIYNGYKFSCVLTYSNAGTQMTFLKNDKWKNLTLVIQSELRDPILLSYNAGGTSHNFIDRSSLYTLNHKIGSTASTLDYIDTNLSGTIYKWEWQPSPQRWKIYGKADLNGNLPNFKKELVLNENGTYNDVRLKNPQGRIIDITQISEVTESTFLCSLNFLGIPDLNDNSPDNLEIEDGQFKQIPSTWQQSSSVTSGIGGEIVALISSTPIHLGGGYNAYLPITEEISFATLADKINRGDPEIKYVNVDENGSITFNDYVVELSKPDFLMKGTYLNVIPYREKPSKLRTVSKTIGYEISALPRMSVNEISRYRGYYNPKWRDLIKFIDTEEIKNMKDINGNHLTYNNIQILTDEGYVKDSNILTLKNYYFNKVNVESPTILLRSDTKIGTVFPILGEIAIDYKDIFLFKSNWDTSYYTKNTSSTTQVSVIGARDPKENKSFFGSKIISMPSQINLEKFPEGVISEVDLQSPEKIKKIPQNITFSIKSKKESKTLTINVFSSLALENFLISDGFGTEFYKYIDPNYSFGSRNQEDDIKSYISENITERYVVKDIIFWEKYPKRGENLPKIEYNLSDEQKVKAGYVKTKNFQTIFRNPDDLDFKLIYNIPQDRIYSVAFTVILEKK